MNKPMIKILVVEDDAADFMLVKQSLLKSDRNQYNVQHISEYNAASEALYQDDCDLILLDYFLGSHSGLELLQQAKTLQFKRPIIVMTGSNSPELDDMLMKEGAADFIPKDELSTALLDRSIRHAIERKEAEFKIAELVRKDPLTGLGNRYIFEEHMELAIARAARKKQHLAVIFLDLDRFKDINDSLGHHVGDLLLTLMGDRLRRAVRKSDFVARIGGDEFTALIDNIENVEEVNHILEKISREMCRPAPVSNTTLDVTVSMGVAIFPHHGQMAMELMQKADMALYESKAQGAGGYHIFTDRLQARLIHGLETEKELRHALRLQQFELFYQPQIDLDTGAICGLEALIRWNRSDGQVMSPIEFIPVAVRSGLIVPIGCWVIEAACKQLQLWREAGLNVPVSVNVSPRQLKFHGFLKQLLNCIKQYRVPPGMLELELTEEALIENGLNQAAMLGVIRNTGVGIAIDDFGTGYSSMRYLREFPLDRIKIDKSFVSEAGITGLREPAITQSILSLAQGLGLSVVAEGVETNEQKQQLQSQGCRVCQGYLYYRPLKLADLEPVLRQAGGISSNDRHS
ncbi:GGDEF domain-containing response regulator [Saccharospirillum alexandrii]|uniref:GGDEF domain-containing response regulator n=1 Tax=Saccharospirillum alexandrii TaxID=2448477 RepID=UPI000FD798DA|nr:GGDEF domain-containing response regulator [Saccharospirillum alexandrii]